MSMLKNSIAAAIVSILAGTAIFRVMRHSRTEGSTAVETTSTVAPRERRPSEGKSIVEQFAKHREGKPSIDRKKELERLKTRWMEAETGSGIITKEQQKSARETAELLLCGREALELLDFLKSSRRTGAANLVRRAISEYLASRDDPEARQLLIELTGDNWVEMQLQRRMYDPLSGSSAASQRYELLTEWSKAAGRSCSPETLEDLCRGMKHEECAMEALIGYNTQLMRTDPEAAVRAMVKALQSPIQFPSDEESIKLLFWEELPTDIDFAKLESLIPTGPAPGDRSPGSDPFNTGRRELFISWAKSDPAAAANHVIAHPDRLGAELMESIVGSYYYKDHSGVAAWVSQFPPGPYFDAAAHSAAIYTRTSTPDETRELVLRIGDPKIREDALKQLAVPGTNPNTR